MPIEKRGGLPQKDGAPSSQILASMTMLKTVKIRSNLSYIFQDIGPSQIVSFQDLSYSMFLSSFFPEAFFYVEENSSGYLHNEDGYEIPSCFLDSSILKSYFEFAIILNHFSILVGTRVPENIC
jgi:hypothetical protein